MINQNKCQNMAASDKKITIALAGNPNSGKTVIFNALTGSRQKVANWSGVTVEKKSGLLTHRLRIFKVVDLPGIYSLSVTSEDGSIDERIASTFLLSHEVDLIVNVLDANSLERNLYLTLQLLEMKIPVILAVNMLDVLENRGIKLDLKKLSQSLDCPVVGLVASRGIGIQELKDKISEVSRKQMPSKFQLPLPKEITTSVEQITQNLQNYIDPQSVTKSKSPLNWMALKLLEGDKVVQQLLIKSLEQTNQCVEQTKQVSDLEILVKQQWQQIETTLGEEPDILIADARYGFANEIVNSVLHTSKTKRQTVTQIIDRVVLNRFLGIPIFLFVMYLMFLFSINIAGAFQDFFDIVSDTLLVQGMAHLLTKWHFPSWITAILANGLGKGINTTITFIPVIGGMFLFLSFLEDSGYMARAAFIMDRLMRALGLPGKSFIPMVVGFGCNVPAVMGTRTLANPRDRILTVMMMPFMSCSARLAIFAVFVAAFFQKGGEIIIFALYILGILAAMATGLLLRKTLLRGDSSPLVMDLPPYHLPRIPILFRHAFHRLKSFLFRAGKVIIPVCMIIGVLNSITIKGELATSQQPSVLAEVGRVVTPVLAPMGIQANNWPATAGLLTGILAKEVVIGTLNTLYGQVGHLTQTQAEHFNLTAGLKEAVVSVPQNLAGLGEALSNPFKASEPDHDINHAVYGVMHQFFGSKMSAFAYLLFVLLYFPCISTLAAMRREVGNAWAYFSMFWSMGMAYGMAVMVYQSASIMRSPLYSLTWIGGILITLFGVIYGFRRFSDFKLMKLQYDSGRTLGSNL